MLAELYIWPVQALNYTEHIAAVIYNPLTPTVAMCTAIKHPVPDRVKPPFVIFDIRALWRSVLIVRVPGCQKLQMTVWHRISGVARGGFKPPPIVKMCVFYCLWLSLHFFNSVRNSLSDDLNVHSGIKETRRVCDCVTDYRDAARRISTDCQCIVYTL